MPCLIKILTPDGLVDAPYTADSLDQAAGHEPTDGVYTVTNTYDRTRILKATDHFDRLEDSARRADIAITLDRTRIRATLRALILQSDYGDVRFRLTIDRAAPQNLIISIEPYTPPASHIIEQGVRCITAPDSARANAAAKTTGWMHTRKTLETAMPAGIYDTFLLDAEGYILEGLASNFYAILGGRLRTAGQGVLRGISQQIVFEIAPALLPLDLNPVHRDDIAHFEEAFLTSSSRGIIPIVAIDGTTIGDGQPGPLTRQLRAQYIAWSQAHLEEL